MGSARGTDDEWAGLDCGDGVPARLREEWRWGLSYNRAAPEEILIRLIEGSGYVLDRRDLPDAVLDAAIDHPDRSVRGHLVEARWRRGLSPAHWSRLLLGEASAARRALLAGCAADGLAELTDTAYEALAGDPSTDVRAETAGFPHLPARLRAALAEDPAPRVRAAVCRSGWPHLDTAARERLLTDPAPEVRRAAALARHEEVPVPAAVFDALPPGEHDIAASHRLERDLAVRLVAHTDAPTRARLAGNPYLDRDLVEALAADPEDQVRLAVSGRPEPAEELRFPLPASFDPRMMRHPLPWVVALHEDPAAMRRLAASQNVLVRSSVALARRLPPDVVERLARDEDRVVRLFLAERCDDAPADMLLEVWQWWNGSFSTPDRPYGHPNFPRRDLLRHAEHPNGRMRQLALDDPDSTPELVERFSRDEDPEVRERAATDPRLSAESAARLTTDPAAEVRHAAACHPRLPLPVLTALLADRQTALAAARNPAIPLPVMRRMAA